MTHPIRTALLLALLPAASQALTEEQWREDAAFACAQMPRLHANLFHTLSAEEFASHCQRLQVAPAVAEHRRVLALAELVARIGDGHSRLTLPMDPAAGFFLGHTATATPAVAHFHHLPVRLRALTDGWLIVRATEAQRALLGASVVRVGELSVAEVAAALESVVQRDNAQQLGDLSTLFAVIPEVLEARGVTRRLDAAVFTVRFADGREQAVTLRPVEANEGWLDLVPAGGLPLYLRQPQRNYWFETPPGSRTTYFRFAEVVEQPGETIADFAHRLYRHVQRSAAQRLVIDLRGNPGGSNNFNAPLVVGAIRATRLWEPGGLFVITDAGTFSAAMNLATDLERWTPAIFAGEPTGARPNHYGDARKIELPHSHLTIRLSSLYWQDSSPLDRRDAIAPLLPVAPTMADVRAGRDPVLEDILAFDAPPAATARSAVGVWRGELASGHVRSPLELRIELKDGELIAETDLAALRVEAAAFTALQRNGAQLAGTFAIRDRSVGFAARLAGDQMVGWLEHLGERYPLLARRID